AEGGGGGGGGAAGGDAGPARSVASGGAAGVPRVREGEYARRWLPVCASSCSLKGQVPTARPYCHSSHPCWNQPANSVVRSLPALSDMHSIMIRLPMRSVTGGT